MGSKKLLPDIKLTLKEERFCELYVSKDFFGHGVEAYAEAYGKDLTNGTNYNTCKVNASKLLMKDTILKRIDQLMEESGLNNAFLDKQMWFVVAQNSDLHAKMKAIDSANKLRNRIQDKLTVKIEEPDYSGLSKDEKLTLLSLLKKAKATPDSE